MVAPLIWIERSDYVRLLPLARSDETLLAQEMARAIVCGADEMPSAVAKVGDRIGYRHDGGPLRWTDLVYPEQAEGPARVCVTSSLGAALIGMRAGSTMDYLNDHGEQRHLVVEHVVAA